MRWQGVMSRPPRTGRSWMAPSSVRRCSTRQRSDIVQNKQRKQDRPHRALPRTARGAKSAPAVNVSSRSSKPRESGRRSSPQRHRSVRRQANDVDAIINVEVVPRHDIAPATVAELHPARAACPRKEHLPPGRGASLTSALWYPEFGPEQAGPPHASRCTRPRQALPEAGPHSQAPGTQRSPPA